MQIKTNSIIAKGMILLLVFSVLSGFFLVIPSATPTTGDIGYELLDDGAVLHIWNKHDSYYFNTSSGIQITNHYEEYWTHNVLMLGYYSGDVWNLIYRTDALSGFNRDIDTDGLTYVNATIWKDLTYNSYNFRLAIRYCLGVDDSDLTVIPYIKNLGIEIPYQLAFGWEMKDIQIAGTQEDDRIRINRTRYFLNQSLDNKYDNLSSPIYDDLGNIIGWEDAQFYLEQINDPLPAQFLYLKWNKDLLYLVTVKSRVNQYNAPVTLFIRIGILNAGQEKSTELHWYDAEGHYIDSWEMTGGNTDPQGVTTNGINIWVADLDERVYQYDITGGYIGFWEMTGVNTDPRGIATDSTNIWIVDFTDNAVYKYNMVGGYIDSWSLTASNTRPTGITTDGTNIWVVDSASGTDVVYKYNMSGGYINSWSLTAENATPSGITTDGTNIWIVDSGTDVVYKYNMVGGYIDSWELTAGNATPTGIAADGTNIWVVDLGTDDVYKYWGPVSIINSNPQPVNRVIGIDINPYLNITVNQTLGSQMNVTKRTNASGSWVDIFWLNNTGNTTMSNLTSGIFVNYNTIYWWSVNTTNGLGDWDNDTYSFTTRPIIISDYSPISGTENVTTVNTTLSVTVNHTSGKNMTVRWYSNGSGSWVQLTFNTTSGNETCYQISNIFSVIGTIYYWKVSVEEDINITNSPVYWFRTAYNPLNPTNLDTTYVSPNLNITWTTGTYADSTVVVRNNDSLPTSPTDGYEAYNTTLEYYNDSNVQNQTYFMLFSYNSTWTIYSSGVSVDWGGIDIAVFNESDNSAIANWDVFVTNQSGTETYEATGLNNRHVVGYDLLPTGTNIAVQISAEDYQTRYYYIDLSIGQYYILNAYLPSANDSNLYVLIVTDEYDLSVEDAKIEIKQYINETIGYTDVSVLYTDTSGSVSVYLLPDNIYKIIISKTGYITEETDYIPDPDYYGMYYPKYFKIRVEEPEIVTKTFGDICTFTGEWNTNNNTLRVYFYDDESSTTDITIWIYESYNDTLTWKEVHTYGSESTVTFYNSSTLNTSRMHKLYLEMNHTTLGHVTNQVRWVSPLIPDSGKIRGDWINQILTDGFGPFSFDYVNFFLIFLPCILIIVLGGAMHHPGLGVVIAGGYTALFNWRVLVSTTEVLAMLITLFFLIGFIVIISKKGRGLIK